MKRLLLFVMIALISLPSWSQTSMVIGRIKSPLKVATDYTLYTLTTPAQPTVVTSGATGTSCSSSRTYHWYTAYIDEGGVSALSPASAAWTPSPALKKATITRPDTAPSNAKGWLVYMSNDLDGDVIKYLAGSTSGPTTLEAGWIANGTTSLDKACFTTGMQYTAAQGLGCTASGAPLSCCTGNGTGTCNAGLRTSMSIDTTHGYVMSQVYAGGNINLWTSATRQLDISGTNARFSSDSGTTWGTINTPTSIVTVCASGCQYTTLNSACAAVTSTAANPVSFLIGPGTVSTATANVCSGQDHAAFIGYGKNGTILAVTGVGGLSGIDLAGSDNSTVANMTINAGRPVTFGTGSGGINWIENVDLTSPDAAGITADCMKIIATMDAGSEIHLVNNRCVILADGFTIATDTNVSLFTSGNHFVYSSAWTGASGVFWFNSIPCTFVSENDTFELTSSLAATNSVVVYYFDGSGAGCGSTATAVIRNPIINVVNTSAAGNNSAVTGVSILSTATELGSLRISGGDFSISIPNDTTTGTSIGIDNSAQSTTVVSLYGTRIGATGGQAGTRYDLKGNVAGSILVGPDSDWLLDNALLTGDRSRNPLAAKPASCTIGDKYMDTSGAYCVCTATGTPGTWTNTTAVGACV